MVKKHKLNLFILAGEDSGDLHGSHIIQQIQKTYDNISLVGLGGKKLEQLGLHSFVPLNRLAVMGFWEVLKQLPFFLRLEKKILNYIITNKPDKIILIDYPGFNLRLAQKIKEKIDAPIYYYISPQLWAWKEKRIEKIKKFVDYMIVIFPFEKNWYKKRGVRVQYFGHPLIDLMQTKKTKNQETLKPETLKIALCPGSRIQEIKQHMPIFEDVIQYYGKHNKNIEFVIYNAPGINAFIFNKYQKYINVKITSQSILSSFHNISLAIVASGTATLECAITLTPFVVVYKMSFWSWFITKRLVTSEFASIVNILAKKLLAPELLQKNFTRKSLIKNIEYLLDEGVQKNMISSLKLIRRQLGEGSAYNKTAQFILNEKNN